MNAGLVDLIATIRGIVRRPNWLYYPVISDTRSISSCLVSFHFFFFYNSIFPFSSRCHIKHVPVSRGIRKLQLRHATTQPDLKLNYHGIIVDSDSALRWYELFTTFRSRHYFLDCSVNTAIFPFREILRYASWFNNDGVEIFLSRDHCALFA